MRRANVLWLLLAGFCSVVLFHTSQKVHDGREQLSALSREAAQEEESIRVLQAEWSYLNQPKRLESLAKEHLNLVPMKGARFASIDDIGVRAAPQVAAEKPAPKEDSIAVKETSAFLASRAAADAEDKPENIPPQKVVKKQASTTARKFGDVMKSLGVE